MKKHILQLNIKSINKGIRIYCNLIVQLLKKLKINFKYTNVPVTTKKITLLKSPHVNKKAREQFDIRKYKSVLFIHKEKEVELLKFLILNKPKFIKLNLRKII